MVLCEDWGIDVDRPNRVSLYGLISSISSLDPSPYPLLYQELCVFLALTEGRGTGHIQIRCVFEETGQKIFETPRRRIKLGEDPLEVMGLPVRIRDCLFPQTGIHSIQFWYNGHRVSECPLRLR
jgi:hypothetical protein